MIDSKKIFKDALSLWGEDDELDMMIEEMAELTKAIIKLRRGRGNGKYLELRIKVSEEIADVKIMIGQMEQMFSKTNIDMFYNKKLRRLKRRIRKAKNENLSKL
jgi:hypothetical protein